MIALGTGIAAGFIANGSIVCGASSRPGELGHVSVIPGGETCACGMTGCAEAYAGGASMSRRYGAATGRELTARQIFAAAADDARRAVDHALAAMIVGCVVTLDPQLSLIGGGLSGAGSQLMDPLRPRGNRSLTWRTAPPIENAAFGTAAALVGAALVAWDRAAQAPVPEVAQVRQ